MRTAYQPRYAQPQCALRKRKPLCLQEIWKKTFWLYGRFSCRVAFGREYDACLAAAEQHELGPRDKFRWASTQTGRVFRSTLIMQYLQQRLKLAQMGKAPWLARSDGTARFRNRPSTDACAIKAV